jgi:very-short-patch-repair endonuclease
VLVDRGYHLVQQWKVGAYRLDMVAVCKNKTVAIECDGERYHSGEAKVREDMERQTILERLGWRFIRIRGSEYFRNPEKTMDRVMRELSAYEIYPDFDERKQNDTSRNSDLFERVKHHAAIILENAEASSDSLVDTDTIAVALNPKSMVPAIRPSGNKMTSPVPSADTSSTGGNASVSMPIEVASSQKHQPTEQISNQPKQSPKGHPKIVSVKTKKPDPTEELMQMILPEMVTVDSDDIIAYINKHEIPYVDKRSKNGSLWIIGGKDLEGVVRQCKAIGYVFTYAPNGSKATGGKSGWYSKSTPHAK